MTLSRKDACPGGALHFGLHQAPLVRPCPGHGPSYRLGEARERQLSLEKDVGAVAASDEVHPGGGWGRSTTTPSSARRSRCFPKRIPTQNLPIDRRLAPKMGQVSEGTISEFRYIYIYIIHSDPLTWHIWSGRSISGQVAAYHVDMYIVGV